MLVLYPVVMNLWVATQNWLSSGLDNVRTFFEIFFEEIMKIGRQETGGEVMLYGAERGRGRRHKYMRRVTLYFLFVRKYVLFLLLNMIEIKAWMTKVVTWVGSRKTGTTDILMNKNACCLTTL